MKISLISDVHVKNIPNDLGKVYLEKFLNNPYVLASDVIVFLGDVFDLMVGPYVDYRKIYCDFFSKIDTFLKNNKKIFFFEGNHDFHCKEIFKNLDENFFMYIKSFHLIENNGKRILLNHGDEVEIGNYSYRILKYTLNNKCVENLLHILPFSYIEKIGSEWSNKSRNYNAEKYDNTNQQKKIKEHYRLSAQNSLNKFNADILICGHGHVQDIYIFEDKKIYSNNGYVPNSKVFTYIDDENKVIHIPL